MGIDSIDQTEEPAPAAEETATKQKRERSTIEFTYSDLDSAVGITRTIRDKAGASCEVKQLAGWLDQSASSGTFRSRYSAARIFGFTETERGGKVSITELGRDLLDSQKERDAKARAFLNVELFRKMYEEYNGHALPPAPAIARIMIDLGVGPKQADRARQTFSKSAQQANFIDEKSGRFVKPGNPSLPSKEDEPPKVDEESKGNGNGSGGDGGDNLALHPFIQGLLKELPPSGTPWPEDSRKLWLDTAGSIFKIIYQDSTDG